MKFTKKAFQTWLESKTKLTRVGRPESRFDCPLCQFLKAQGADKVNMTFETRMVNGTYSDNPLWAYKFQRAACQHVKTDGQRAITANTALSFL